MKTSVKHLPRWLLTFGAISLQFFKQSWKQSVGAASTINGRHCHDEPPAITAAAENKNERRDGGNVADDDVPSSGDEEKDNA